MLTPTRLRELVHYDPNTGVFTRIAKMFRSNRVGQVAGTLGKNGYVQLQVGGVRCLAHRLAFLYMTGEWPVGDVDHVDGRRTNNAWANLRDVTKSTNLQNRKGPTRVNQSGYLGVCAKRDRWAANISINGKTRTLGVFDTPEEAHQAYLAAKRQHHEGCTL